MSPAAAPLWSSSVTATVHPLVACYTVDFVPDQALLSVEFGTDTAYGRTTSFQLPPPGGGPITTLVAGMRPNTTYLMHARIQLPDGSIELDRDFRFTTGSLPVSGIPEFCAASSGAHQPGIELVNSINSYAISVATDLDGHVIWYYHHEADDAWAGYAMPLRFLDNGNFLVNVINLFGEDTQSQSALREVSLTGETVQELDLAAMNAALQSLPTSKGTIVQAKVFSHDATPLPNGYVAVIVLIDNPPVPGIVGDAIVVVDLAFRPVWVWSAFDWLDVHRNPWGTSDWTHGNTITSTPDGGLLFSARAQSWILKLDYRSGQGTGAILWKLGPDGDFALANSTGPNDWFYNQHCAIVLSEVNGTIMTLSVFDNGNRRPATPAPNQYSRALILTLDENTRQAAISWQYCPPAPHRYSYWGGNVKPLPNGNIEVDIAQPRGLAYSLVQELTPDTQQTVWQMEVRPPSVYRAFRLPSLYFGVQW